MSARIARGAAMAAALVAWVLVVPPMSALAQSSSWSPSVSWSRYVGGSAYEELNGIVTSSQGEIFVTGETNSTNYPLHAGLPMSGSKKDAVVSKFNENGSLAWTLIFGGSGDDRGTRVALAPDSSGDVYVVGRLAQTTLTCGVCVSATVPAPVLNSYGGGDSDAYLARLKPDGTMRWLFYVGGEGAEDALALAVDPNGQKVYVAGKTTSFNTFPGKTSDSKRGDGEDAFVTQVDVTQPDNPSITWTRILGTKDDTLGYPPPVANDAAHTVVLQGGAVFVGGIVGSRNTDVDPGMPTREGFHEGDNDGFVVRLRMDGGIDWFTNVGSDKDDEVRDLLVTSGGGLVVVGNTDSSSFATSRTKAGGAFDVFLLRLATDGTRVTGEELRLGKGGNDHANVASMDQHGNIFIGGKTESSEFAFNAFDAAYSAGSDGFVAMVDAALTKPFWISYVGGGSSTTVEWVRGLAVGSEGRLTLSGHSESNDVFVPAPSEGPGGSRDGFLARVKVDTTGPNQGKVKPSLVGGRISATWGAFPDPAENFSDPESGIANYDWAIGTTEGGEEVLAFEPMNLQTMAVASTTPGPTPGVTYYVTVRATNGVGLRTQSTSVFSLPAPPVPPGGGTGDGTDGDTGKPDEEGMLSPLGWGCGSTGSGGVAGALGLAALALLSPRRTRVAQGGSRGRGPEY